VRHVHGPTVTSLLTGLLTGLLTSLLAGLLGVVLVAAVLPASAAPIPARYLTLYRHAARTGPGLSWPVLAGIGTMESDNGRTRARGVHRGRNRKGAEGPMQFEPMRRRDANGQVCHWILEVHLVDRERQIGGFYEELLDLGLDPA
jgi:hypothetical protein